MKDSYKVLKKAIDKAGAKKVASDLKLSQALIYKWCQKPNDEESYQNSGAQNPLDRLRKVFEVTEDPELINWVCQMADGYYVQNPQFKSKTVDAKVLNNVHKLIKEFSETLDVISGAYHDDKEIDQKEAAKIRKEWEDLKRIGEGFVQACESGKFAK